MSSVQHLSLSLSYFIIIFTVQFVQSVRRGQIYTHFLLSLLTAQIAGWEFIDDLSWDNGTSVVVLAAMGRNSINTVNYWATHLRYMIYILYCNIDNNCWRNNVRQGGREDQTESCLAKLQLLTDHDRMGGLGGTGGRQIWKGRLQGVSLSLGNGAHTDLLK